MEEFIDHRDRIITILATDYTDLALGLGETKIGIISLAFSSANLMEAASRAKSMGHSAVSMNTEGRGLDEEMMRFSGMVALAWSRRKNFQFRYVNVIGKTLGENIQEAILFTQGDFRNGKPSLQVCAAEVKMMLDMYGISNIKSSSAQWFDTRAESMAQPQKHPQWDEWVKAVYERAHERKKLNLPE